MTDDDKQLLLWAARALEVGAAALEIAHDWNLYDVQVDPPKDWALLSDQEDAEDGWCSTSELARKMKEIAAEIGKAMGE